MNNFDRLAPIYDRLVRLVFGKSMMRAQTRFLSEIDPHSEVLILGGGTGWLLAELVSVKPDCKVTYIDASEKMIDLAREKIRGYSRDVSFIHGTERSIPAAYIYDVVITHFYLDLFEPRSCREVCDLIRNHCHPGSLWLACDFVNQAWWHSVMLKVMYIFFGMATGLRTRRLPDWRTDIRDSGFIEIGVQYYCGEFIWSSLFREGIGTGKANARW